MELFNKKFFGLLFVLTVLICLCTVKVEGMESQEPINPFAPLQELCKHCISRDLIWEAFNNTFGLICARVVHSHNPSESISWLEDPATGAEIKECIRRLNEQITQRVREMFGEECFWPHLPGEMGSKSGPDGMGLYYLHLFQTLKNEEYVLYKKIAVLISLLDEVPASDATSSSTSATGTDASSATSSSASTTDTSATRINIIGNDFLDNAKLLQDTVESKIMWEGWEGLRDAGQAVWKNVANSCELL